jgi:phosphoribosylanthranilate isomerase
MIIKICGIQDKNNLLEIISLKPDMMGFIFYPVSARFVGDKLHPDDLVEIPKRIKRVGVFVNADEYEINGIFWKYNLDMIQLHGEESPSLCRQLSSMNIPVIKAFQIDAQFDFNMVEEYLKYCKYFLFDTKTEKYGGSGSKFNWEILKKYNLGHPFILSGGIAPGDEDRIISINNPSLCGVDINSRFESAPGIKDIPLLKTFIQNLREK